MWGKMRLTSKGSLPEYKTKGSAGLDIHLIEDVVFEPKEVTTVHTGLSVEIPDGYFGAVYPRSSVGTKYNLMLANTVGIIDSDYRGEIMIFFYNYGDKEQIVRDGDRLAQLVIQPYARCEIIKVNKLADSERGEGGFGSTGE